MKIDLSAAFAITIAAMFTTFIVTYNTKPNNNIETRCWKAELIIANDSVQKLRNRIDRINKLYEEDLRFIKTDLINANYEVKKYREEYERQRYLTDFIRNQMFNCCSKK